MTGDRPGGLAHLLGDLAIQIQDQADMREALHAIVTGAVALVPGARWAGVSLIEGRRVRAEVPTDALVAVLDQAQTDLDEGPCLSALREQHTVHVDDMSTETRWPRFTEMAVREGALSLLSFQLFVRSRNLGALNLYGDRPGAFTADSFFIGELLAQHAVRGHEKVPTGGQVEVSGFGQVKVSTPCSSCRSGTAGPDGDGEGANQTPPPSGSSIEVCEGPHGYRFRLLRARVLPSRR